MESLKRNGDEKQAELVNKKKDQMMNAVSATQRNFQECVMEAANRYPILEDDNSSLRRIQSSQQYNQTLAQQQEQPQPLELFSMGPTHPVDQLPDLNLTPAG
ncbi:uncharacterized protein LOC109820591 isoform X1 [Asparagus officinalis]|uniref:uncharacterized protein LOC109820591 isoform X1 n=1 Tax=Asparagus officinalis TaxID=4686 RepID=UPI00098DE3E2|nr:uncharacterized protein LOC109820591 isoform X1 [Asparagus officinalis]